MTGWVGTEIALDRGVIEASVKFLVDDPGLGRGRRLASIASSTPRMIV